MSLILDSSLTLAWLIAEERTQAVETTLDEVVANGAWVPSLWSLEIANALEMGVRRGRHDETFRDRSLDNLSRLPVWLDPETNDHAWGATLRLATRHRLTVYDAAYLELARRRGLPLATLDHALRAAAAQEEVPLLGL